MQLKLGRAGPHTGYVIDGALDESYLASLDAVRTSLPIDTEKKQTAAARRFFCAEDELQWIRDGLVRAISDSLSLSLARERDDDYDATATNNEHSNPEKNNPAHDEVRVLPWARFLEYREPNGSLGPHTDALIRCKETGAWSTHTLIVFCADCDAGGETTLLPELPKVVRAREKELRKAREAVHQLEAAIEQISISTNNTSSSSSGDGSVNVTEEDKAARLARLQTALTIARSRVREPEFKPSFPVQPKRGRIFFFPHECPHEGRPTVSVPKVFLRAELLLIRGNNVVKR